MIKNVKQMLLQLGILQFNISKINQLKNITLNKQLKF